jgi:hypothetical protein
MDIFYHIYGVALNQKIARGALSFFFHVRPFSILEMGAAFLLELEKEASLC